MSGRSAPAANRDGRMAAATTPESVLPASNGATAKAPAAGSIVPLSGPISAGTLRSADAGSGRGRNESASSFPTSANSDAQTSGSSRRWRKPRHVRALAAQVNEVATQVLNGDIDFEKARLYANLTRTLAQTISAETTRARFAKEAPDLSLEGEDA